MAEGLARPSNSELGSQTNVSWCGCRNGTWATHVPISREVWVAASASDTNWILQQKAAVERVDHPCRVEPVRLDPLGSFDAWAERKHHTEAHGRRA